MRRLAGACVVAAAGVAVAGPGQPALPGPAPEVTATATPVALPALPAFELPAGPLTVARLRAGRSAFFGTRVVLRGFVTFAYDCAADIRKPGESDRAVRARIDADPTLCERPKFYVGDAASTSPEHSLWVVDVPRPYNKLELANIPKAERTLPDRCEPHERDPKKQICPPYREGDEVIIAGTFATSSPHSEANSDGLIVYEAMRNVTRGWQTPGESLEATMVAVLGRPKPAPKLPPLPRPIVRAASPAARNRSDDYLNRGNVALSNHDLAAARAAYQVATSSWDGNALAWYGLGLTALERRDPGEAANAFSHAVELAPAESMYQMWDGIAQYEATEAVKSADFSEAELHLRQAIQLVPRLWRAHYYLGKIARGRDEAREAAAQFAEAIRDKPSEWAPYIALDELMRRWDYDDQAIAVATVGTQHVTDPAGLSDMYYELAMGHDAKHEAKAAIDGFTHALDANPGNLEARYQRGQSYFRLGDFTHAKADLEQFVTSSGPTLAFARQQANKMLMEIAARSRH